MSKSFRISAVTAALISLAGGATAQNVQGPYVAGGIGAFYQLTDEGAVGKTQYSEDFGPGGVSVLSLGYGFGNGIRAEIETAFRASAVNTASIDKQTANGSGRFQSYAFMANVFYDLNLSRVGLNTSAIVPYFGAGIGYHLGSTHDVRIYNATTEITSNDQSGRLAYQVMAGLSFPIAGLPGLAMTAEYRMFNDDHGPELTFVKTTGGTTTSAKQRTEFYNHGLLVGLRYVFNAAPVVAAAAAPIAASRTFLVFFDWSQADLTERARQIIGEAAAARGQGVTRIEVNGFTDRSGAADYNMQLSVRRANAVAAELVRRGVPRNEIVTRGFGEENNLVPTADGVREPQNRRVEIILK